MNIAFLYRNIQQKAGIEKMICSVANALARYYKERAQIYIIEEVHIAKPAFPLDDNVKCISLYEDIGDGESFQPIKHLNSDSFSQMYVHVLKKTLQEHDIDALIICMNKFHPLIACIYSHTYSIVWNHFPAIIRHPLDLGDFMWRFEARYANSIVSLTHRDAAFYKNKFHPFGDVRVIPNMVDQYESVPYNSHGNVILAVGRITLQKGFDRLLDIWGQMNERSLCGNWELWIVGKVEAPSYGDVIYEKASKMANCKILPPTSDMAGLYQKATLFVMASIFEAFALVLGEAQSAGLPAVAYDCFAGPSDIIADGESGFVVEDGNADQFCEKLLTLMNDVDMRERFSKEARKRGKLFEDKTIVEKWDALLREASTHSRRLAHWRIQQLIDDTPEPDWD